MVLVSRGEGLEMIEIKDNFLDQHEFNMLQNNIMGVSFPWYYNSAITVPCSDDLPEEKDKFQFVHVFYENCIPGPSAEVINPIITNMGPILLWRIKANLLTKTPNIVENDFHVDVFDGELKVREQLTTSIFYVNTNNGYTKFEDGSKIESVANRLLSFPSNMKHTGTSCTDEKIRIVINFNYLKIV